MNQILPHYAGFSLKLFYKIVRKISYNMRNLGRFETAITQPIEIPNFVGFLKNKTLQSEEWIQPNLN